jgi:hypothetical protein
MKTHVLHVYRCSRVGSSIIGVLGDGLRCSRLGFKVF